MCLVRGGGQAEGMGKMGDEGLRGDEGLDKGGLLKRDGVRLLERGGQEDKKGGGTPDRACSGGN